MWILTDHIEDLAVFCSVVIVYYTLDFRVIILINIKCKCFKLEIHREIS